MIVNSQDIRELQGSLLYQRLHCMSNNLPVLEYCCGGTYSEKTGPWLRFVSDTGRPTLLPRHNSRRL